MGTFTSIMASDVKGPPFSPLPKDADHEDAVPASPNATWLAVRLDADRKEPATAAAASASDDTAEKRSAIMLSRCVSVGGVKSDDMSCGTSTCGSVRRSVGWRGGEKLSVLSDRRGDDSVVMEDEASFFSDEGVSCSGSSGTYVLK